MAHPGCDWLVRFSQHPRVLFGFIIGTYFTSIGAKLASSPNANFLLHHLSGFGVSGVFLLASFIRGRIIGHGDISAGVSNTAISRWPLVIVLCALTAIYSLFISFAGFKIRPDVLAQRLSYTTGLQVLAFFVAVFIAPLAEELFFRGWLWNGLKERWNALLTASVVSVLWLAVHLDQGVFLAAFLLPVALLIALARHFCRSVRASIAVHMTLNLVGFAAPWLFRALD